MNQSLISQSCILNVKQTAVSPVIEKISHEECPYTRLVRLGPEVLSDAELLSLVLEQGTNSDSSIKQGRQLIHKFGGFSELGGLSIKQLAGESGMSVKKAVQLLVSFEFSARCAKERMTRLPMNSAESIYQAMAPRLAHKKIEYVSLILLDSKLQAMQTVELSRGNAGTALCEPRDVLHQVIINQASAFVMIHNHPSGDPGPSRQDLSLTKKIQQASEFMNLRFVDHLIIGRPRDDNRKPYYSFTEAGVL